eukprot:1150440-Pelagomonas_calceolata.AAC.3
MPRSFALPEELPLLRQYMEQQQQQRASRTAGVSESNGDDQAGASSTMKWETVENGGGGGGWGEGGKSEDLWILKTAQHLGKGLKVVTASQLVEEATSRQNKPVLIPSGLMCLPPALGTPFPLVAFSAAVACCLLFHKLYLLLFHTGLFD